MVVLVGLGHAHPCQREDECFAAIPVVKALNTQILRAAKHAPDIAYLAAAVRFATHESLRSARGLLWTSLVYLPALLLTLVWDHFSLLS